MFATRPTTRRRRLHLGLGIGIAAAAVVGCTGDVPPRSGDTGVPGASATFAPDEPEPPRTPVEEPQPSDVTMPIVVMSNSYCEEYSVEVEETADRVRIEVLITPLEPETDESPPGVGTACPDLLESRTVDVRLEEPLGQRTVIGPVVSRR